VQEEVYELSPVLGQVLEDLIEEDPARRLLNIDLAAGLRFATLRQLFELTFELVDLEPVASKHRTVALLARFLPASREPLTQFRKWWRLRRDNRAVDDMLLLRQRHDAGYLLFFSALSALAFWFTLAATGWPEITDWVRELPHRPQWPEPARTIALGQALVLAKYYQTVLARLTVRGLTGILPRSTEVVIRIMPLVAIPTTLIAVWWHPSLWAWSCAAGATAVALANLLTARLAISLCGAGREARFSTTPAPGEELSRGYEQWWWTMLLYAFVIGVIAWGLQTNRMHDEGAYVFGLLVINIGIHYLTKCSLAGFAIRGSLARAFALGNRLTTARRVHRVGRDQPVAAVH
jgi:hypothetical protein